MDRRGAGDGPPTQATPKAPTGTLNCLTYQSLAAFDSEDVNDGLGGAVVDRLHPNGVDVFERIRSQPQPTLMLVLDECHHLLDVWVVAR